MKRIVWIIILLTFAEPALAGTVYVKSVKARLLSSPSFKGETVLVAPRGSALEELERKGKWVFVEYKGKKGWAPKYIISTSQPMKRRSRLARATDLEKSSRRRASAFTSVAAARGLTDYDRTRRGDKNYTVDYDAIEIIKSIEIDEDEAVQFIAEGVGQ